MTFSKIPVLLLVALLIVPVVGGTIAVVLPAFGYMPALDRTEFTLDIVKTVIADPRFTKMLSLSMFSGLLSTLMAVCLSVVICARYFEKNQLNQWNERLRPVLVIPHAGAAIAIGFVLAPSGLVVRMLSPLFTGFTLPPSWAVPNDPNGVIMTLVLALKEFPFILMICVAALHQRARYQLYKQQLGLAKTFGYSSFSAFILVVWPQLYSLVRLPILAVLVYTGASIEIPLILGPSSPSTLAVSVLTSLSDVDLEQRFVASAIAIIQIGASIGSLFLWLVLEKSGAKILAYIRQPKRASKLFFYVGLTVRPLLYGILLILLCSLFGIVLLSFAGHWPFQNTLPEGYTISHWLLAFNQISTPLSNALGIAFCVSSFSLVLCVTSLEGMSDAPNRLKLLTKINYMPLIVPMVVFMFGASFVVTNLLGANPLLSVLLLHFIVVTPYVWISLAQQYQELDPRLIALARTLGASNIKIFFRIKLPLLTQALAMAFALGMSISFSQYLPTLLGGGGTIDTITTEAVALASGGSRRLMSVYSLVQIAMPMIIFSIVIFISTLSLPKRTSNHA